MLNKIFVFCLLLGSGYIDSLGLTFQEKGEQGEAILFKNNDLTKEFKKFTEDFRKVRIGLWKSFSQKEVEEMIALATRFQKLSEKEKLFFLTWIRECYFGVGVPECKTVLLLNLSYNKEIDYQEELKRSRQFAIDNDIWRLPIVFPFSIKRKGDRSLFISHRPNEMAKTAYAFLYEWYMTEEYTGNRNYRDLAKVDYFLEDDSTEVKALFQKLKEDQVDARQVVTKEQFKNALDNARQYQNLKKEDQRDFLELLKKTASHGQMDLSMKMKVTMLIHLAYDKDLFYEREKKLKDPDFKPLPSFAITIKKRKGKTLFIPHKPEEKYLKDHGLCACKPLKSGYLDDVKLRNLDSVIYSEE